MSLNIGDGRFKMEGKLIFLCFTSCIIALKMKFYFTHFEGKNMGRFKRSSVGVHLL